MNILSALANAAAYYFQIKATSAAYDLSTRIESDIAASEAQLARLRKLGDPASQLAGDRLVARILRQRGIFARVADAEPVPAAGPAVAGGVGGADGGRHLHAGDG